MPDRPSAAAAHGLTNTERETEAVLGIGPFGAPDVFQRQIQAGALLREPHAASG